MTSPQIQTGVQKQSTAPSVSLVCSWLWVGPPVMRGNKIKPRMKLINKLEATYGRKNSVRVTGEPSKASWVDDAVGVILVAS